MSSEDVVYHTIIVLFLYTMGKVNKVVRIQEVKKDTDEGDGSGSFGGSSLCPTSDDDTRHGLQSLHGDMVCFIFNGMYHMNRVFHVIVS